MALRRRGRTSRDCRLSRRGRPIASQRERPEEGRPRLARRLARLVRPLLQGRDATQVPDGVDANDGRAGCPSLRRRGVRQAAAGGGRLEAVVEGPPERPLLGARVSSAWGLSRCAGPVVCRHQRRAGTAASSALVNDTRASSLLAPPNDGGRGAAPPRQRLTTHGRDARATGDDDAVRSAGTPPRDGETHVRQPPRQECRPPTVNREIR